jgi:hypothetical protein
LLLSRDVRVVSLRVGVVERIKTKIQFSVLILRFVVNGDRRALCALLAFLCAGVCLALSTTTSVFEPK